jgi:hypothetical protein
MSTMAGLEKIVSIGSRAAAPPIPNSEPAKTVMVISTSINRTIHALEKASELAKPLRASIVVVAVQVVPYSLPLDRPTVSIEFVTRRFEEMASRLPGKIRVFVCLCRDPKEALSQILTPNGPVVMGIRKRWWLSRDERLARNLRRAGYNMIVVDQE